MHLTLNKIEPFKAYKLLNGWLLSGWFLEKIKELLYCLDDSTVSWSFISLAKKGGGFGQLFK